MPRRPDLLSLAPALAAAALCGFVLTGAAIGWRALLQPAAAKAAPAIVQALPRTAERALAAL
jgi:hypothetical protein